MAPRKGSKSESKKFTRSKSKSTRRSHSETQPTPQHVDPLDIEEHTGTPSSAQAENGSDIVSQLLDGETCSFLFKTGTTDLAEIIQADQGSDGMTVEALLSKLERCSITLQLLLDRRNSTASAVARYVDPRDQLQRQNFARYFETYWTNSVMEHLTCQAYELEARVRVGLFSVRDEWEYARLGRQAIYGSGTIPLYDVNIGFAEWCRFSPKCVSQNIQQLLCRLDDTYHTFQAKFYLQHGTPEDLKLWYLIWTNLKKTFFLFTQNEASFPSEIYRIEREFFVDPHRRSLFEWVSTSVDCLCPQEIEDLVGDYVELVYRRLEPLDVAVPVSETFIEILSSFPDDIEWNYQALDALHQAVFRLNYLTDGPSLLRRLGRRVRYFLSDEDLAYRTDGRLTLADSPAWFPLPGSTGTDMRQAKDLDRIRSITHDSLDGTLSNNSRFVDLNAAINAGPTGEEISDYGSSQDEILVELIPDSSDEEEFIGMEYQDLSTDDVDENPRLEAFMNYTPQGRNIISAYDYVYCPIPENRAYEVANSRLISRDLRTPGYISDGLQTEDLVNLPPAHCRTPGTWTSWKRRIPFGPFDVLGLLGTAVADRIRGRNRAFVTRPLAPPNVTSREGCRHRKHKNKLRAQHDSRTRITKSSVGQRGSLRGGGSRHSPALDDSPSRRSKSNRLREQRPASNTQVPRAPVDPQLAPSPMPPRNRSSSSSLSSGPRNSNEENKDPSNAGPPPGRDFSGLVGTMPTSHVPGRQPLAELSIHEDEAEEGEIEEAGPSNHVLNSQSYGQLLHSLKQAAATGDRGEPHPNCSTISEEYFKQCHPCPIFEGQYHHICHEDCIARRYTILHKELLDPRFFKGSLWETINNRFDRCNRDAATMQEFVEQYHRTVVGEHGRSFHLSNGAMIEVSRQYNGMQYDIKRGPLLTHRANHISFESSGIQEGEWLARLPQSTSHVEYWGWIPDRQKYDWILFEDPIEMEDLLNPDWHTKQCFRITYYRGTSQDRARYHIVRLERFETYPWETLVIKPLGVQPRAPHVRDYEVTQLDDAPEATRNAFNGYTQTLDYQAKLKENAEHAKKRQADAEANRQNQAAETAETATGEQDNENAKTGTDIPAASGTAASEPDYIPFNETQAPEKVPAVDEVTDQNMTDRTEGAKQTAGNDKATQIAEQIPADEPPKASSDHNNDDQPDTTNTTKPTKGKTPAAKPKNIPAPIPRITRGAAKKAADEAAGKDKNEDKDESKTEGKSEGKQPRNRGRQTRRRGTEDSDDEASDVPPQKAKNAADPKGRGKK